MFKAGLVFFLTFLLPHNLLFKAKSQLPIRIGVLQSLTGPMADSGKPLVDVLRLGIEEINAQGGLLNRPLEMLIADGKSDIQVFTAEARRLIEKEKVSVLFACWTSSCRKAIKPIVEKNNHLLIYTVQFEGLEQSPNILYTGSAPNQQIIPGTHWAMDKFGPKIYLVGSDYIFPKVANLIIRDLVAASHGQILAEKYLPLNSSSHLEELITDLKLKKPDVILNTLNGIGNAAFFSALISAGLVDQPIVSFSVAEGEMKAWGGQRLHQHYVIWSYFQSLEQKDNQRFVSAFQERFGKERLVSDPMEATYVGLNLWAQTVRNEKSVEPIRVNGSDLLRQSFAGPSGVAAVDYSTRHLWKMVRVGKIQPDGQFQVIYNSEKPLKPTPWPIYRTKEEWQKLIEGILIKKNQTRYKL